MKLADVNKIYEKFEELRKDDIKALQEWVVKQPHLPPVTELELVLCLHSCYYSMEMAKATIDNFYTYRTYCPQFFSNLNPRDSTVRKVMDTFPIIELSTTPQGYKVLLGKMLPIDVNDLIFVEMMKVMDMSITQCLYSDGPDEGFVIVFDMAELKLGHLVKCNILDIKKLFMYLQEALPVRLKGIHYINVGNAIDVLMGMVKPFIKKEVIDMLHFYETSSEKIFEFVPKELFPSNYGGKNEPFEVLHEKMIKRYIENVPFFQMLEKLVVDDSKRLMSQESVINVFGTEGSFKKLSID